jgi:tRNA(adenine34) deaminase
MKSAPDDQNFMRLALKQAGVAFDAGEIPVGAIVVCGGTIVARTCNQTQQLNDVTAHAEMLAITAAANYLGGKYLPQCTLYVTLEPCPMCAGALFWSQIGRLVYGARDEKRGYSLISSKLLHPKTVVTAGLMSEECASLLQAFFQKLRN